MLSVLDLLLCQPMINACQMAINCVTAQDAHLPGPFPAELANSAPFAAAPHLILAGVSLHGHPPDLVYM